MAVTLKQLRERIVESGLMTNGDVEQFVAAQSEKKFKNGEQLARLLVKEQKLTAYQAKVLYKNKGKDLVLGNYIILDKLGQGGMGMVLKAEHKRMRRLVALKVLAPSAMKSPDAVQRFHREVEAAAKLEHQNIVTAYDADEANGVHFLVMHYIEGTDLSVLVKKKGPVSVDRAVSYIKQAATGLEYAHLQGVVHRDIKPANLLLDGNETVKILDMGLARIEGAAGDPEQAELTGTGMIMGTVDYMSPEQAMSTKSADARSDIYSLGISLWYLLVGKSAYEGDSLMAKMMAHQQSPIPSLCDVNPQVPAGLNTIFQKMIAKKPEDRYQTMTEVIADLEQGFSSSRETSSPDVSVLPSEDSKLNAFLDGLGGESPSSPSMATLGQTKGQTKTKAAKTRAAEANSKTINVDAARNDNDPETHLSLPPRMGKGGRVAKASAKAPLWQNRKVQIGAGAGGVLLLVVALMLSLGGSKEEDKSEQTRLVPGPVPSLPGGESTPNSTENSLDDKSILPNQPLDLLANLDPEKLSSEKQKWELQNGVLMITGTAEKKGLDWSGGTFPQEIRGDYDIELEFKQDGFIPLQIDLPLGNKQAIRVHLGGLGCALIWIDGKDEKETDSPYQNEAARMKRNVWHQLVGKVRHHGDDIRIDVTLDGISIGQFFGSRSRLSFPNWLKPDPVHAKVAGYSDLSKSRVEFRRMVATPIESENSPRSQTLDLLAGLLPSTLDSEKLTWTSDNGVLSGRGVNEEKKGWMTTVFPREFGGDYDFDVEFKQTGFTWGSLQFDMPLGDEQAIRILVDGNLSALMFIDGKAHEVADEPHRSDMATLKQDTWHRLTGAIRQQGDNVTIDAALDGERIGRFSGSRERITPRHGLGSRDVQLKLSGNGKFSEMQLAFRKVEIRRGGAEQPAPSAVGSGNTPPPAIAPFDEAQAKEHQKEWAKFVGEPVETTNSIGMKLAVIPPGEFMMGEGDTAVDVTLTKPFRFGIHEITQGQWKAVMATEPWKGQENIKEGQNIAVTFVSWTDAVDFCHKLTERERTVGKLADDWEYRLPTEAEWEYACSAGTKTDYSFGNDVSQLDEYAWHDANAKNADEVYAHAVGLKRPNGWGLHDMHGNVWELCSDWKADELVGGDDPQGPLEGSLRVVRGGSWGSVAESCQSSYRNKFPPSRRMNFMGFRVALSIDTSKRDGSEQTIVSPSSEKLSIAEFLKSDAYEWTELEEVKIAGLKPETSVSSAFLEENTDQLYVSIHEGDLNQSELAVCERATDGVSWLAPKKLSGPVNTSRRDSNSRLFNHGLGMIFSTDRGGEVGDNDLWLARRDSIDEPFGTPVRLGGEFDRSTKFVHPAITEDGLILVFDSNHAQRGPGREDLWISTRASLDEQFASPVNLGETINSPIQDVNPVLSRDGTALLFVSNRREYQYEVWMSTRSSTSEPFGPPVLFGVQVAGKTPEMISCLTSDASEFSVSFKKETDGATRVFVSQRVPKSLTTAKPKPISDTITSKEDWVDLLPLVDPKLDSKDESASRVGDDLELNNKDSELSLPVLVNGEYQLRMEFTFIGAKYFNISCPIGDRYPDYALTTNDNDRGFIGVGINPVDGKWVNDKANPTHLLKQLMKPGKRQSFKAQVTIDRGQISLQGAIDDEPFVNWTGAPSRLRQPPAGSSPKLRISTYKGHVKLHKFELKMLDGEAKLERPADAVKLKRVSE